MQSNAIQTNYIQIHLKLFSNDLKCNIKLLFLLDLACLCDNPVQQWTSKMSRLTHLIGLWPCLVCTVAPRVWLVLLISLGFAQERTCFWKITFTLHFRNLSQNKSRGSFASSNEISGDTVNFSTQITVRPDLLTPVLDGAGCGYWLFSEVCLNNRHFQMQQLWWKVSKHKNQSTFALLVYKEMNQLQ